MIANRGLCNMCYLFRRTTFHIYKTVCTKPILFRLIHLPKLNFTATDLFTKIRSNKCFKYYSQASVKQFQSNVDDDGFGVKGKVFLELENDFFHDILKSKEQYKPFIYDKSELFFKQPHFIINEKEFNDIISKTDWSCVPVENVVYSFFKVSVYCAKHLKIPISDEMFKNMCVGLVQVSNKLNDEQLLNSIKALCLWTPCDSVKAKNFLDIWKALDNMCYLRLIQQTWDLNTCFYVIDLWYALKLTRLSEFAYKAQRKFSRKVRSFKPNQLIQMLFFMNICRSVYPGVSMYEYEYVLEKTIPNLTIDELAIAASGFFKTKTKITSVKALSLLANRLSDEVDTAHNITIASILKIIRFSFKPEITSDVNFLITKLIPRMDTKTISGCVHTVLVLTPFIMFNERAINKLVERFLENPAAARLKDMEKITFILSLYNYIPQSAPHVLQTIVNELNRPERETEYNFYSRSFANLLYYLSLFNIYPQNLIAKVLDETWLNDVYGKHPYRMDKTVLSLDYSVELECPDAKVPHLSDSKREYIAKVNSLYIPGPNKDRLTLFDKHFIDVLNAVEKIFDGKDLYLVHYVLPQFAKPDIIYCLDDDNRPVPIPEEMRNKRHFSGILKPTQPGKWHCIIVGSRQMHPFSSQSLVGEQVSKIRQLKIIGYTPVLLPWYCWNQRIDYVKYVKQKVFANEQNC